MSNSIVFMFILVVVIGNIALALYIKRKFKYANGQLEKFEKITFKQIDDRYLGVVNAISLQALDFKYPIDLDIYSIDSHHARVLTYLIMQRMPKSILELGSGSSTIITSLAVKKLGYNVNRHVTIDHKQNYLDNTRRLAFACDVEDSIDFIQADLEPISGFTCPWYSINKIPEIKYDLVIVDGPPSYPLENIKSRSPALIMLRDMLSDDFVMILDDANRDGERAIVQDWKLLYPELVYTELLSGKGVVVISSRPIF